MATTPAHILVVEDEPIIASAIADRLQSEGFGVTTVDDGLAAVDRSEELEPDLVCTRTVDSHVRSVRRKLGGDTISTVHGVGYAFGEPT